jgi:hypothetical protein
MEVDCFFENAPRCGVASLFMSLWFGLNRFLLWPTVVGHFVESERRTLRTIAGRKIRYERPWHRQEVPRYGNRTMFPFYDNGHCAAPMILRWHERQSDCLNFIVLFHCFTGLYRQWPPIAASWLKLIRIYKLFAI